MDLGNFDTGVTIYHKFTTYSATNGSPATLSGGTVSIYKNNASSPSVDGVTLIADFDSKTGLNHLTINTAASNTFYSAGGQFDVILTAGTVNGVSAQGKIASFKLSLAGAVGSNAEIAASNGALLASRLTATRAGYLDQIPQAASNASNTWVQIQVDASNIQVNSSNLVVLVGRLTATRAGYLDQIPQAASNASNTWLQTQVDASNLLVLASNMSVLLSTVGPGASATNIALLVLTSAIDSTYNLKQYIEAIGAAAAGKSSGVAAGSPVYRNLADDRNVITGTATDGDRSASAINPTP